MVNLEIGEEILKKIQSVLPKGYYAEMIGSVKYKGFSFKDLDILIKVNWELVEVDDEDEPIHRKYLREANFELVEDNLANNEWWKNKEGILIDLFFIDQ